MTGIATQSIDAPQRRGLGSDGRDAPTLSSKARRVASACRAVVTARARLRRRSRPSGTLGVLYLLETGGPGGAERMLLDLAENLGPGRKPEVGVMKARWLEAEATVAGSPFALPSASALGDIDVLELHLAVVGRTHV